MSVWKILLKSEWNTILGPISAKNFREQRNVWKGSPYFPVGMFQTEIQINTNFRLLWLSFSVDETFLCSVNAIPWIILTNRFLDVCKW